ncbi:MAG TPA: hypothetical protein DGT21_21725 [Armatimonadetes bacterium]|nr:hypothetical protein [Armatimonadota bacterium]
MPDPGVAQSRVLMSRVCAWMATLLLASLATADVYPPLELLKRTETLVTVGSERISLTVADTGRITALKAGAAEYIPFISLYSSPRASETAEALRAVQGETGEGRGLGGNPSPIAVEQRGERLLIHTDVTTARPEFADGQDLYRLRECVDVAPNGTVSLTYRFDWLRLLLIDHPYVAIALAADVFADAPFVADYTGERRSGTFSAGEAYTRLDALQGAVRTIHCTLPAGVLDIWFDEASNVGSSRWGQYYVLTPNVPGTTYRGWVYPGTSSTLRFTIKLPTPTDQGGAQ